MLVSAASCTIQVTFTPTDLNSVGGILSIVHELTNQQIGIGVNGSVSTNALAVSSSSIQFGTQYVGLAYLSRTLVLTNVSPVPLTLTAPSLAGPYSQSNNCPSPLAAGASCRVFVTFSATANGDSPGSLTISHNSAGGSQSVQLDGTGLIRSDLSVSPLQIVFPGNTLIGIGAGGQTLTLQNTSAQALTIGAISISPSVFGISANTCSTMIAPTATCTLTMTCSPTAVGPVSGAITIPHNGAGSPQVVSIFGTATTQLSFTPATVNFGDQEAGTTRPQSVLSVGNGSSAHP